MTEEKNQGRRLPQRLASLYAAIPPGVWRWARRLFVSLVVLWAVAFGAAYAAMRFWVLPNIGSYRQEVATQLTQAIGHPVTIGRISGDWDGIRPRLMLEDVTVFDQAGRAALHFSHLENVLSWWSLPAADLRLHSLTIDDPVLLVQRDNAGLIYVAGIPVNRGGGDSRFADWLLHQHRIVVRNAVVRWQDDLRQAPPIELRDANLILESSGSRHRFGFRATPQADWVSPIDIRGDLRGNSAGDLADWRGQLYAKLGQVDLLALQRWVTIPLEITRGSGGVQVWFGFAAKQPTEFSADVRLTDVSTRLAPELPVLDLHSLNGRIGWKKAGGNGMEIQTQHLALTAQDNITVAPADVLVRTVPASDGKPASGALGLNGVDIDPLLRLVPFLPVPAEARKLLADVSPHGRFDDFSLQWEGEAGAPKHYSLKGKFARLGMKPYGKIPGLSGVSGKVEADEKSGSLSLSSRNAQVDMPLVFRDAIPLDSLDAQVRWKVSGGKATVTLSSVDFASAQVAGNAYGSYETVPGGKGIIDLTGHVSRADARYVGHYIPLLVAQDARNWLDKAFLAGHATDAKLRLKGNLDQFPFVGNKDGIFQVTAKASGVTLLYGEGWPKIENLDGDLLFEGARMEVTSQQGSINGVKITRAKAVIPDLMSHQAELGVSGETSGATDNALRFVNESPVHKKVEGFTEGLKATGNGRLALNLRVPLTHALDTTVSGLYQFMDNRVEGGSIPTLEHVNGTLLFTQSSVKAQNATARIFDGPATLNADTQPDGTVHIGVNGRMTAAGLKKLAGAGIGGALTGEAEWRVGVRMQKNSADVTFDSNLAGLGSSLPAPFAKRSHDAVPLHVEKRMAGAGRDVITVSYGGLVSGNVSRSERGGRMQVERGVINIGKPLPMPESGGLWLGVNLDELDVGRWTDMLDGGGQGAGLPVDGLNIRVGKAVYSGRTFHDIHLTARNQGKTWQGEVRSGEVNGSFGWDPTGNGTITANLRNLVVPDDMGGESQETGAATALKDMPDLKLTVASLELKGKKLGRFELDAAYDSGGTPSPADDAWRVQRLLLTVPDEFTLDGRGRWDNWRRSRSFRSAFGFKLDVKNLGKFMARVGYPDTISRGRAEVSGTLSWMGPPQQMDFATLRGQIKLEAHSGQFLKADPGIGKLIGILSLQSLPRRITLDFRDVFSEGFAFDSIGGSVNIANGLASSDDFYMDGPAAKVVMKGSADLVNETQNLQVQVVPQLSDSVALAGAAVGGPVVGIPLWLAQKLFKDPLGHIVAYHYEVTGTWSNPKVVKTNGQKGTREGGMNAAPNFSS